jgi:hypothetical protein
VEEWGMKVKLKRNMLEINFGNFKNDKNYFRNSTSAKTPSIEWWNWTLTDYMYYFHMNMFIPNKSFIWSNWRKPWMPRWVNWYIVTVLKN